MGDVELPTSSSQVRDHQCQILANLWFLQPHNTTWGSWTFYSYFVWIAITVLTASLIEFYYSALIFTLSQVRLPANTTLFFFFFSYKRCLFIHMQPINVKASFYSLITTLRLIVIASAGPSLNEPFSPLHRAQSPHRCRLTWITPSSLKETTLLKLLQYFEKTRWKIEFLKTISSSMLYVWITLDISDPDIILDLWFSFHHFPKLDHALQLTPGHVFSPPEPRVHSLTRYGGTVLPCTINRIL